MEPLITQTDAAAFLHQSERTLERWRLEGRGPVYAKVGRKCFYTESALAAFVEKCLRQSTSERPAA